MLGAMFVAPTTNDVKNFISIKLSSVNFKVLPIRFGGKHSSHSEENYHDDDDDDDGADDDEHEHEQPMSWLHRN